MDFKKCNLTDLKNSNETYYDFASDNLSETEKDFQIDSSILTLSLGVRFVSFLN